MDIEKELIETIRKKREAEKKLEKVKGKRVPEIEVALAFLKKYANIETTITDRTVTIVITPKKEYEFLFLTTEPFKYQTTLTKKELEDMRKTVKAIATIVLDRFMMNYPKLPFILDFEMLVRRTGRPRAIEIFMYLCQKGSPYHCGFLYSYLNQLVEKVLDTEDRSERAYLTEYINAAGFKNLAKILAELDIDKLNEREKEMIKEAVKYGLREVLSKYATVYEKPTDMPETAIKKSWSIVFEACKEPDFMLFPQPVDETPIIQALKAVATRIPELKFEVEETQAEITPTPSPEEIKKLREEYEKLKEEKERLMRELEELRMMREKLREKMKKYED